MANKGPAFFGALSAALGGGGSSGGGMPGMNTAMDIVRGITGGKGKKSGEGKPPVDNSHSHGSSSEAYDARAEQRKAAEGQKAQTQTYTPRSDGSGTQDPSFMGKGQTEKFASLTDTSSVDRGGRSVSRPGGLDATGIEPAMNPPMGVPVQNDLDKEGTMNSLYSPAKVVLPKKSGTQKDDATYGIKATSGIKRLKK